ncbi:L-ascorbate metabolism protein UlaG (beta-lactamase superfamily) [Curtobacterium sp. PhB25]|uniref:MBL fold metallo-hydrolase n=1 Tax=unclassified Curtobacterium TaxID=257496 RepID=UPI001043FB4B|nr:MULTISPECIES: MBL fold metallo-hydrolase [unclassified Curtobacterium]TCU81710.1 L-ascorbate metabolism protein UlaG (beta-lactamase superfamily) [Curtobacterium sp. PhB191]TDW48432.1 L-ascorbate metabolism protein UlaG (beta-lactamase superfamily) [Curtobacterium sp. PhB42]TDW53727.1 L-ascorbate metabolism protein UlaG (beta-lactamase superfamily) [Curtobacterium sp. PhB190]TDW64109.1 L-ascorbate metabolism protein UlaG (beta-lactamase superfamily) [Curtobacterium sp. PhB25]
MELTKYNHATVVLEQDGTTLVIDPGTFTPEAADLAGAAAAVLITHEHADHFDVDAVRAGLDANPSLVVRGPAAIVEQLGDHDGRVAAVRAGDAFEVGPFSVQVFGEQHAVIHRDIPTIANVGYLVNGTVFHPGDAYLVPGVPVGTLLIPTSGPWANTAAAVDYVREVAPQRAIQIHELLLSDAGQQMNVRMLGTDGLGGVPTTILQAGEHVTV